MPTRPEVMTNLFQHAIIVNAINPATGVAAPFTYDSNVGNVVQLLPFINKARVANFLLTTFGVGAGVTLDFEFNESDTGGAGTYTPIPDTQASLVAGTFNNRVHLARIETQYMTKGILGAKLVIGGAGAITQIVATWIEHNFEGHPHIFRQFGNIAPYKIVDLNQRDMV